MAAHPVPPFAKEPDDGLVAFDINFETWLANFAADYNQARSIVLSYGPDAAKKLTELYVKTIEERVRPNLKRAKECNPDRHKVISVLELCIMYVKPLMVPNGVDAVRTNAEFALTVAKNALLAWTDCRLDLTYTMRMWPLFDREHVALLTVVDIDGFPIFANAAVWYLYEQLAYEKARNLPKGFS